MTAPLTGVRVFSLGGIWAGRIASLLLADQGAEVIEIVHPRGAPDPARALLGRGKTEVVLDLATLEGQSQARALANGADIVIDNLGPGRAQRIGLDAEALRASHPALVHVSIPAFATGAPLAGTEGWEGAVAASVGVYTDIHALGPSLGGPPIFSAVPMASAYAGVHAAIAACVGFLGRLRTGAGAQFEVPMADALLSAMALLIMHIRDIPDFLRVPQIEAAMADVALPILRELDGALDTDQQARLKRHLARYSQPLFGNTECGDGRYIFINAVGHVHQPRALLETLGLLDQLIAEGAVLATPYAVGAGNNLSDGTSLSLHWKARLRELVGARLKTRSAAEWELILLRAGVPAAMVRTADEWLSWPVAGTSGAVVSLDDPADGPTRQPGRFVSISGREMQSPPLRSRACSGRADWSAPRPSIPMAGASPDRPLEGLKVLDLSNIIAGPAATRILAEFGARVTRVEPVNPFAGPRMTLWFGLDVNQGKRSAILDLKTDGGGEALRRLVLDADVVVHNFLGRSVEDLGISEAQLRAIKPDIVLCHIGGWAGAEGGEYRDFPAYDPVLQAATGIMARYGGEGPPVIHGLASCVDFITGFTAALGIVQALIGRQLGRGAATVGTSLAMGAQLVQSPLLVRSRNGTMPAAPGGPAASGYGPHYRIYRAADGWAMLCCRTQDLDCLAAALGCAAEEATLSGAISALTVASLAELASGVASVVPVTRLNRLRERIAVPEEQAPTLDDRGGDLLMVEVAHPSGHRISLPFPSWYRSPDYPPERLDPAPRPGRDTWGVLQDLGFGRSEIVAMIEGNAAAEHWRVSPGYFP